MSKHTLPLVGAHFRPPAKAILQILPGGAPLILRCEPTNPYDPNAVQVLVESKSIPEDTHEDLGMHAQGYGFDLEAILAAEEWHLGYVKATEALWLHRKLQGDHPASLGFLLNGNPAVNVELLDVNDQAA
jgi:hypothetical protein